MGVAGEPVRLALLGWPVGHSLSPAMFEAAFRSLRMEGGYDVVPTPPDALPETLAGLAGRGLRGCNVTIPHKEAVMPYLDVVDDEARRLGAVNVITVDGGGLAGENTDARGFLADLRAHDVDPAGAGALVLGAGGAAVAVADAVAGAGAAAVHVLNRTPERAARLIERLRPFHPAVRWVAASPAELAACSAASRLVVNCTPVGMAPNDDALAWDAAVPLRGEQVVYDVVYRPRSTRLLRYAASCGARAIDGTGMLLHQAALAFRRWTGRDAPLEAMAEALRAEAASC